MKRYAKSGAIGANLSIEMYASMAKGRISDLMKYYNCMMDDYDRDGNYYLTKQDAVVRVLTEVQVKTRLSSYIDYIDSFVIVSNVGRNLF